MAKFALTSKFSFIVVGVLLLVAATLFGLSQTQILEQHAALAQFTSIAVTGSVYLDTNKNGAKDTGETNYTSTPLPKVRIALFSQICPTPSPKATPTITGYPVSGTPAPTAPANCHYQTMCPKIACAQGKVCPTCAPTLVCTTPGPTGTGGVVESSGLLQGGTSVKGVQDGPKGSTFAQQLSPTPTPTQQPGSCREFAQRFIDCTVSKDGTYLCSAANVTPFTSASVSIEAPSYYYKVTSKNPVIVSAAAATVDFGLAPSGIVTPQNTGLNQQQSGLNSGNKLPFTIHVNGVVSGVPVVVYVTESKGGSSSTGISGVFTTDTSGNIVINATPNETIVMVPVASKGYSAITPARLEVTVSHNSCGLDSPCVFTAAH